MTAEEKSKPSDQQPQQQGCTPIPGTAYCVPASSPTVYHSKSPAPVVTSHGGGVGRNNVTDEEVEVDGDGKKNADLSNETSAVTTMIRKLSAEFAGTSSLVFIVVGSGIHATQLSDDIGIQLTINFGYRLWFVWTHHDFWSGQWCTFQSDCKFGRRIVQRHDVVLAGTVRTFSNRRWDRRFCLGQCYL